MSSKPLSTSPIEVTYLRFFNSLLLDFPVHIYVDEKLFSKKLDYELFSKYVQVPSGAHTITFTNGITDEILLEKRINLRPYSIFTYTMGYKPQVSKPQYYLYTIEENFRTHPTNHCFIRLNHLAHPLSSISLIDHNEHPYFKNIPFGYSSRYAQLTPDVYDLFFNLFESNEMIYKLPKFLLKPGRFYSFYLIGQNTPTTPYQVIVSIDGNSFLTNKTPPPST